MEKTNDHVFITGKAGTGKSTLLNYFRTHTTKQIAVLAPTGVAAVNVQGQTIHSFFKFKPTVTLSDVKRQSYNRRMYQMLDTVIIDEISMARADLVDCVDKFLRLNGKYADQPFGGTQMIFVGDLYQLPPIVSAHDMFAEHYQTPYFFSAQSFANLDIQGIELDKVYRQQDHRFIDLLNAIRNQTMTEHHMTLLNTRHQPDFVPHADDCYVHLTPRNSDADAVNHARLEQLTHPAHAFEAKIKGEFGREYCPALPTLRLKQNAQVMMVNNDAQGRWVNGTMGRVVAISDDIKVTLETGADVFVRPHTWDVSKFTLAADDQVVAQKVGSMTQYPMILAWAITIHKSQGKTFRRVIFDIGRGAFAAGQVYVALSRCTSLEGLVLKRPIETRHIWTDQKIVAFMSQCQRTAS